MTDSLLQKVVKKSKELNKKDNHALSRINSRRTELLNDKNNYLTTLLASELELILEPGEGMMPLDDLVVNYYCYWMLKVEAGKNSEDLYDRFPYLPGQKGKVISWSMFVLCLSAVNSLKDKRQPLTRHGSSKLLKRNPLFSKVDFRRENAKWLMKYAEMFRKEIYGKIK